jgi:hypothetical protein
VDAAQLQLRRTIFEAFAATGAPPDVADSPELRALAERHVLVLDDDARIRMAHPFAAHADGARVDAQGRTWRGNCAWDGFGIVHALELPDATITAQGRTIPGDDVVFHVQVPARHWWDDIGFT